MNLDELKLLTNPRIFLANYFDDFRNQIDIACELFLTDHDFEKRKDIAQIQYAHSLMINEVNTFEQELLDNLLNNYAAKEELLRIFETIEKIESDSHQLISGMLLDAEKVIFMNQGIIFLSKDQLKKKNIETSCLSLLVRIQDEFISNRTFWNKDKLLNF